MTDPTSHLDLDALADHLAGQTTPAQDAHLAGCASCQVARADLLAADALVRTALGTLPEPAVPPDLAARLDDLIQPAPVAGTATVLPAQVTDLAARRRLRWLPVAGGVAAAAVLVLGALVLTRSGDRPTAATTSDAAGPTLPSSTTGNDYAQDGGLLRAALPGLLSGSPVAADAGAAAAPAPPGQERVPSASLSAPAAAGAGSDALAPLRDQATLAACLAGLSDDTDPGVPLALDYASYQGAPALVVVLPTTRAGKVDVFVVGPRCTQADADLLFFTRLDDPR